MKNVVEDQGVFRIGLAHIAKTARDNAAACLDLAGRFFEAGDRAAADQMIDLAQQCMDVAQIAEADSLSA